MNSSVGDVLLKVHNVKLTLGDTLILDEAHNLEVSVLETIRLLSNFETSDSKLMHIILAGQTQLANKLVEKGCSTWLWTMGLHSRSQLGVQLLGS